MPVGHIITMMQFMLVKPFKKWGFISMKTLPCDDIYGYVTKKPQRSNRSNRTTRNRSKSLCTMDNESATDYLRGDVAIGWYNFVFENAHTAETFHMNYEVHHGGNSLNNAANLHLIMAIKNCEYFEVLLPDAAQNTVSSTILSTNGMVHAPDGPGLGMEIDFDLINKNKVYEL